MADFENQNRDFLVSDGGECGDSWPTGYRYRPRFSPNKAWPHCRGSSPFASRSRSKRSIAFWAGLASLVICFSAVRVVSIRQRLAGRLLLGETPSTKPPRRNQDGVPIRPAYWWVLAARGRQCPPEGPPDRPGINESLRGHNSSCCDRFLWPGNPACFQVWIRAHAERVKRV
jgi:hypothetical protein